MRDGQGIGGIGRLVDGGLEAGERISGVMPMDQRADQQDEQDHADDPAGDHQDFGVHLGKPIHDIIHEGPGFLHQRRRLGIFIRALQLRIQVGQDPRDIQLERGRVVLDGPADVDGSGKGVEIAVFKGAQMVGADLGQFGDLGDGKLFGFARGAELFCDRWHFLYLQQLTRH